MFIYLTLKHSLNRMCTKNYLRGFQQKTVLPIEVNNMKILY
jgi:hypothetical protein